jgi:hypothetical protein
VVLCSLNRDDKHNKAQQSSTADHCLFLKMANTTLSQPVTEPFAEAPPERSADARGK